MYIILKWFITSYYLRIRQKKGSELGTGLKARLHYYFDKNATS